MQTGVFSMHPDAGGVPPLNLARLVEDSGTEPLFLLTHSHLPVNKKVGYGREGNEEERGHRFTKPPAA
ncbi:hypothetical protein BOX37_13080 [Nocardia mangyaensis]|uniref:Uncharacterized protein n=1 Tax=Nocardia mangyaensis TaxID=2213200 RepID=A0A1J0VRU2_9NOCA|nr:hypothetical protein [Nocardia mangyaensis]APE34729.1 hypothetical protein BOX37_13080 [Nocardia mangyaensis]